MSAHFRARLDELNGGMATACWRDVCSTAALPSGAFVGELRSFSSADVRPRDIGDGRIGIDFQPSIANGKALELQIADGDRYRFTIRDGRGVVVLDVTRDAVYQSTEPPASSCNTSPCRSASLVFENVP